MMDYNAITERINILIKEQGLSEAGIAGKLGIPQKTLNNQLNGKSSLSLRTILAISDLLPYISLNWLLKGEGSKYSEGGKSLANDFKEAYYNKEKVQTESLNESNTTEVCLLPVTSFDLITQTELKVIKIPNEEIIYMPVINAEKKDKAVPVQGESMAPIYPSGCYIQIREIENWREVIEFGQVFIIELKNGRRLLRKIKKGKNKSEYKLEAYNPEMEDFNINIDFINSIWIVVAKLELPVMS